MGANIAIFASGSGSNAENIFEQFKDTDLQIKAIFCNNEKAFVIERSKKLGLPCELFSRALFKTEEFLKTLEKYEIDFIVLAGFLWKIPNYLIQAFPEKIINIHPSLLPKYGGKGMYGGFVHQAVVENKETESGISIHLVNEHYDEGKLLFQAKCEVTPTDSADDVASKVHALEYTHFPKVVSEYITQHKG